MRLITVGVVDSIAYDRAMASVRRYSSLRIRTDTEVFTFNGDLALVELSLTGTYAVLLDGQTVWQQQVEDGVAERVVISGAEREV